MDLSTEIAERGYVDAIVVLKPVRRKKRPDGKMALDTAGTADAQSESAEKVRSILSRAPDPRAEVIKDEIRYQSRHNAQATAFLRKTRGSGPGPLYLENLGLVIGPIDRRAYSELLKLQAQDVRTVLSAPEMSLIKPQVSQPANEPDGLGWGLKMLGVEALWAQGFIGADVLVGHMDTGIDAAHPMLSNALDAFAQFDYLGAMVPDAPPADSGTHGTYTASVLAGRPVGTKSFGVAPGAKLACATVIEDGNVTARVFAGINWAVGQGAKVVSASLGLRGYKPLLAIVITAIRDRGVLPVIAIGNEGPGTTRTPGNCLGTLSVGACDVQKLVYAQSSSEKFTDGRISPDLVAPGVEIPCASPGGQYTYVTGTSLATPHVAGLAAILWQAHPEATVDQIEQAIFDSCQKPTSFSKLRGHRGIPNGPLALEKLVKILTK